MIHIYVYVLWWTANLLKRLGFSGPYFLSVGGLEFFVAKVCGHAAEWLINGLRTLIMRLSCFTFSAGSKYLLLCNVVVVVQCYVSILILEEWLWQLHFGSEHFCYNDWDPSWFFISLVSTIQCVTRTTNYIHVGVNFWNFCSVDLFASLNCWSWVWWPGDGRRLCCVELWHHVISSTLMVVVLITRCHNSTQHILSP